MSNCCVDLVKQVDQGLEAFFTSEPVIAVKKFVSDVVHETLEVVEYWGREVKVFLNKTLPPEVSHVAWVVIKYLPLVIANQLLLGIPSRILFVATVLFSEFSENSSIELERFWGALSIFHLFNAVIQVSMGNAIYGIVTGGVSLIFASSFVESELKRMPAQFILEEENRSAILSSSELV